MNRLKAIIQNEVLSFIRQKRRYFTGQAITWTGILLSLLSAIVICTDTILFIPPYIRWGLLILLILIAAICLVGWFVLPCVNLRLSQAISEIERNNENIGQMLRTSNQISQENITRDDRVSPVLTRALFEQTAYWLKTTDINRQIPWQRVKKRRNWLSLILLVLILTACCWRDFRKGVLRLLLPGSNITFTEVNARSSVNEFRHGMKFKIQATISGRGVKKVFLYSRGREDEWEVKEMIPEGKRQFVKEISNQQKPFEFYVTAGDGRSPVQVVRFIDVPRIESVQVRLHYPDYTQQGPRDVSFENIQAVEGSLVKFLFKIDRPLKEARLRIGKDEVVVAETKDNWVSIANTLAKGTQECFLEGCDKDGLSLDKSIFTMHGLEDKVPNVEILTPYQDIEVTKIAEVPIRVYAIDDQGIDEMGIVIKVDEQEEVLKTQKFGDEIVFALRDIATASLEKYTLTINSNVRLFAYAKDRKPGRKARGVSKLRAIDIRPFKIRTRIPQTGGSDSSREGRDRACMECLIKLEEAIERQRLILSRTFKMKEERSYTPEMLTQVTMAERELAKEVEKLAGFLMGKVPQEMVTFLSLATTQMLHAAEDLSKVQLDSAYFNENKALSNMLKLRRNLIRKLCQSGSCQGRMCDSRKSKGCDYMGLSQLAREAVRLSWVERDIRQQICPVLDDQNQPSAQSETSPAAALQRQEIAVEDAGELLDNLQNHPDGTSLAINRMKTLEKVMQEGEKSMKSGNLPSASLELKKAEEGLLQLAEHLRGLDEENLRDTLNCAQKKSDEAANKLTQKGNAADPNKSGRESQVAPCLSGGQRGRICQSAQTIADWLDHLQQKEMSGSENLQKRLAELRDQQKVDQLSDDLKRSQRYWEQNRRELAQQLDHDAAKRFRQMATTFEREVRRLVESRLERLASAQAKAQTLKRDLKETAIKERTGTVKRLNSRTDGFLLRAGDLASELRSFNDAGLLEYANILETWIDTDEAENALDLIVMRLEEMIKTIVRQKMLTSKDVPVPDKYDRMVQSYFKLLSDDLGQQ